MKLNKTRSLKAGFSLVEMLVVIAVIGIIAAIAVPNIGRINQSAQEATAKRNAQNLASVFASGTAAGLDFVNGASTAGAIAQNVITGATIPANDPGPFAGTFFGVPGLSADDRDAAAVYLEIQGDQLIYDGTN